MSYQFLADLVLLLHLLFVIFVVLGGLLCFWKRGFAWVHLPAAAWGVWVEWSGWVCPLTPLENRYRLLAGHQGYSESFVEHYLVPLLYPHNLTRDLQLGLGLFVLIFNLIIYAWLWRRRQD